MGLIYLDTCVVIYAFENDSVFGTEARQALAMHPATSFAVSPLVKMECLVSPFKQNNSILQNFYERGLSQFFQLDMPEEVFIRAAALRARFGLKSQDALHLATAQYHGCSEFWTNDERLQNAAGHLAVCAIFTKHG